MSSKSTLSTYVVVTTAFNWYWTIPIELGYPATTSNPDLLMFGLSNLMNLFLLKGVAEKSAK
jgi:hypothetical protein